MLPFTGSAITPVFISGSLQTHTICGGIPTDLGSWLAVNDPEVGNTDTWNITVSSNHGTLSGFPATVASASSGVPSGLSYMPDPDAYLYGDNFTITVDDGNGNSASVSIILTINPGPSLTLGTVNAVCSGATTATLPFTGLTNVGPDTAIFNFTGAPQTFTVPQNITSVRFDLMGASGGSDNLSGAPNPGNGGRIQGTLSVVPFQTLNIFVGGRGGDGTVAGGVGGYNGGGNSQFYFFGAGGAGGGATDIRMGGTLLSNRKVVAGGGGGNGADIPTGSSSYAAYAGGAGGGLVGGSSANGQIGFHAGGGTQSGGGAPATGSGTPGGFGGIGTGGAGSSMGISGGGGGGYFGGGGGLWTGGGGGSSYADNTATLGVTHTQGANNGDGVATLYYTIPGTYTIIWDTASFDSGFVNVANVALPTNSQIDFAVPAAVTPGTYSGTLYISNSTCTSPAYHFSVTVKPKPTVAVPADQVLCHGQATADISMSTSVSGGNVHWESDNPAFHGATPSNGDGHIGSFFPVNTTPEPAIANITITPSADGCIGDPQTFHIIDNPVPALNSTATPNPVCNGNLFSYIPTSLTTGASFAWTRAAIGGITNPANAGTDNPNESLTNTTVDPINVVYIYTLTANTCTNTVNVTVPVEPTPVLTSGTSVAAVCNNNAFTYHATSSTGVAVLNWSRATVTGISNAASSGTGDINETLINTTTSPKVVTYVYAMNVNGCISTQSIPVTVNPTPALTSSSTLSFCSGDVFSYVPTTAVPLSSITWTRPVVAGITPATAGSGTGAFSEILTNTTANPVIVNYIYTMTANGCSYTQTVAATVRAKAKLNGSLTQPAICTNTMFDYTSSSATPGTTITWVRDNQIGISNTAHVGTTPDVHEILYDTTVLPVTVDYRYILIADGCIDTQIVSVVVNPLPVLSNNVSALTMCDSTKFDFPAQSGTPGANFSWSRPYTPGINNPASSGSTNNPGEYLNNTTYISVDVPYMFTISAAGCVNTQTIVVSVRPSPILSTSHSASACTTLPFSYVPLSYSSPVTYAWSRGAVSGITPSTASGTGNIEDTLTSSSGSPVSVAYTYTLTIAGTTCSYKQDVIVTVNPGPAAPVIATHPGAALCGNTGYMNLGADAPPASGFSYSWTANNATIISTGSDKQYALVNFDHAGTASVTLINKINSTQCISTATYSVTVGSGAAVPVDVIYFENQFICRQTGVSSYQWGYDDASTLDSTILVGETNQNYSNPYPDWNNKKYWVITTHDDCKQKTYFNKPTGVDDINLGGSAIKVFPNPANDFINVEISSLVNGNVSVEVSNMLGQKITNLTTGDHKAQISLAGLPAGGYLVDCFSEGVKIGAVRFIKN